ncbi:MAG: glycoside hydrolase family 43 protein [Opitutaceae bacterium]|nr:glycoside hydrolase family 43 protein [Opitutaceae bacterium]
MSRRTAVVAAVFACVQFSLAQEVGPSLKLHPEELFYDNSVGVVPEMADPFILQTGGKYYLYGTDGGRDVHLGFKVYVSTDLVNWSEPAGVHSGGRALEKANSWGTRGFWGAEVYERNGTFYMYYTVEEHLAIATSASPLGPFVQAVKKPVWPQRAIDPHLFVDDDGKAYMYYVSFENRSNDIYVVEMKEDWMTPKEETKRRCIWYTQPWENADPKYAKWPVTEGSAVLKHKGVYYLFYTGNHYLSQKYAVGYATASSPFGPWTKHDGNPILQQTENLRGTGHCSFVRAPNRELIMVYHSHKNLSTPGPRKMAIDRCEFVANPDKSKPDILKVKGPTDSRQVVPWKSLPGK